MKWKKLNRFVRKGRGATIAAHAAAALAGLLIIGPVSYVVGARSLGDPTADPAINAAWEQSPSPVSVPEPPPHELESLLFPFGAVAFEQGTRNGREFWIARYRISESERQLALQRVSFAWNSQGFTCHGTGDTITAEAPGAQSGAAAVRDEQGIEITVWREGSSAAESVAQFVRRLRLPDPPMDSDPELYSGGGGGTVLSFRTTWNSGRFHNAWITEMMRGGWNEKTRFSQTAQPLAESSGSTMAMMEREGFHATVQAAPSPQGDTLVSVVVF